MNLQKEMFSQLLKVQNQSSNSNPIPSNEPGKAINTALLSNFDYFDSKKDSFRNYRQRFENYIEMKNIKQNYGYYVKLLLNSIGANSFNMITALAAPKLPGELKYEELMSLFQKLLAPKRNVLVIRNVRNHLKL